MDAAMSATRFELAQLAPWLTYTFDRASGPGGQNVNKVSTRATVWFDLTACPLLTDPQRDRLRQRLATRLGADGRLRVVMQQARTQSGNRALAERRLLELLTEALHTPRVRRPTRPTAAARERRLQAKRRQTERKRLRGNEID
jgi:ribosome-associated protein